MRKRLSTLCRGIRGKGELSNLRKCLNLVVGIFAITIAVPTYASSETDSKLLDASEFGIYSTKYPTSDIFEAVEKGDSLPEDAQMELFLSALTGAGDLSLDYLENNPDAAEIFKDVIAKDDDNLLARWQDELEQMEASETSDELGLAIAMELEAHGIDASELAKNSNPEMAAKAEAVLKKFSDNLSKTEHGKQLLDNAASASHGAGSSSIDLVSYSKSIEGRSSIAKGAREVSEYSQAYARGHTSGGGSSGGIPTTTEKLLEAA